MDFKNKYLKYKNKYFELKQKYEMIGGLTPKDLKEARDNLGSNRRTPRSTRAPPIPRKNRRSPKVNTSSGKKPVPRPRPLKPVPVSDFTAIYNGGVYLNYQEFQILVCGFLFYII